jgi:pyrroloquinoline quinone (PQQ) biosynthesis protein C
MKAGEIIHQEWLKAVRIMDSNPFFLALENGTFTAEHYAMLLRELYHNTHENPEGLALMTGHLKGEQRRLNKRFFRHSLVESGHDEMAADDLKTLGYDFEPLKRERPLVTTEAFSAFPIFQVQRRNPISYLAYLYHLEQIASTRGILVVKHCLSIGVPQSAMSFMLEHTDADPGHTLWNEEYIEALVRTDEDLDAYRYGLRGSVRLHALMLQGIMEAVDGNEPEWESLKRSVKGPGAVGSPAAEGVASAIAG